MTSHQLPSTVFAEGAYLTACSGAELSLLEAIAREHPGRVRILRVAGEDSDAVTFETDAPPLRDHMHHELMRLRTQRLAAQAAIAAA